MSNLIKNLTFTTSLCLAGFSAAADPLTQGEIECYERILRETYPNLTEFRHSHDGDNGQERLVLSDGTYFDRAEIIFWNDPRSPDFTLFRYQSTEDGDQIATIGSGSYEGFERLRHSENAANSFLEGIPETRDRIRNKDCPREDRETQPALIIG